MSSCGAGRPYVVRVPYTEPVYRRSQSAATYTFVIRVEAGSPEEAVQKAIEEFEDLARNSSVGWVREVRRSEVEVLPPESLAG